MEWIIITRLKFIILFFFFFSSLFALLSYQNHSLKIRCLSTTKSGFRFQDVKKSIEDIKSSGRRILSGPGSWPPRCNSKCGKCTPCKPVHVSVPPGTPVTSEYYPEAWRCKCGNRLYMP